jgi:hypothetical protein
MKTPFRLLVRSKMIQKQLFVAIVVLLIFSCQKEKSSELKFEFQAMDIIYYPDKTISMTFKIIPGGNNGPFIIKWFEPAHFQGEGPISVNMNSDLKLDFEIQDAENASKRFAYEIKVDDIDSLNYDYRNRYIGEYSCNVTSSNNGSKETYIDTLRIVKNDIFKFLNILTRNDIIQNYEGSLMIYNSNYDLNNPSNNFFGYHSAARFSNDSIHYAVSGPMGNYYTNVYEGIRIVSH